MGLWFKIFCEVIKYSYFKDFLYLGRINRWRILDIEKRVKSQDVGLRVIKFHVTKVGCTNVEYGFILIYFNHVIAGVACGGILVIDLRRKSCIWPSCGVPVWNYALIVSSMW